MPCANAQAKSPYVFSPLPGIGRPGNSYETSSFSQAVITILLGPDMFRAIRSKLVDLFIPAGTAPAAEAMPPE